MAIGITQHELLEALATAHAAPSEARTIAELETLTGWDRKRLRDAIGRLAMQDRIAVHQVQRARIDGKMTLVPAYTIKPAPSKAKRNA